MCGDLLSKNKNKNSFLVVGLFLFLGVVCFVISSVCFSLAWLLLSLLLFLLPPSVYEFSSGTGCVESDSAAVVSPRQLIGLWRCSRVLQELEDENSILQGL